MQQVANMVIITGNEFMTKTGKVADLFKLIGARKDYRHDTTIVNFGPDETFVVVRGARGAMNVNLIKDGVEHGLSTGNKGRFLFIVPAFKGKEAMRWERHVPTETQGTEEPLAGGVDARYEAEETTHPTVTATWTDKTTLSAQVVFEERHLHTLGDVGDLVFGTVARNLMRLKHHEAVELKFGVLPGRDEIRVAIPQGDAFIGWRIDPANGDMFMGDEVTDLTDDVMWVTLSDVQELPEQTEGMYNKTFDCEELTATFVPTTKVDAHELAQQFTDDELLGLIKSIMLHESTALSRKWTSGFVVRVISNEGPEFGRLLIERVRKDDEAEEVGDVYEVDRDGKLKLHHHRRSFKSYEGPTFLIIPVEYKLHQPERDLTLRDNSTNKSVKSCGDYGRVGPAPETERSTAHHSEEPRVTKSKIPTREWIPQVNQFVTIEGDESEVVYIIQDFDLLDRKFILKNADSLRGQRQRQLGGTDTVSIEAGRVRPFTLFY